MGTYGQILWFPFAAGLSALGVLVSIIRWRRRGAGSGLRGLAWALLPISLYLLGVLNLLVPFAFRVVGWATHLVFSLTAWVGLALLALAVVLWVVSGVIIGRRQVAAGEGTGDREVGEARTSAGDRKAVTGSPAGRQDTGGGDDDFSDIEAILKRRGIS